MRSKLRWYDAFFILIFFYLFILQIQAIWPFTVDDMYISLRYAKNWSSGAGLLWNANAHPVEGYSNFSFVLLSAISLILKMNPVLVLKYAGFVGLFLTLCFIYSISRFWFSPRLSLLPCITVLAYQGQIIWAVSGLETTVYEALISGSVYFIFRGMGYNLYPLSKEAMRPAFWIVAGLLLSLAGLTRPEAPALMLLFCLLMFWDRYSCPKNGYLSCFLYFLLPLFLVYLPYFLWRWHYYGYVFPNSVYCKGFSASFSYVVDYNYFKLIAPFILLVIPACFKIKDKRPYFLWLPSVVYLIMLREADPVVTFDNRLFLPAFVLLIPLVFLGLAQIASFFYPVHQRSFLVLLLILFLVLNVMFIPKMSLTNYRYFSENPVRGEQLRTMLIHWMNERLKPEDKVVLADAGMIPFYSNASIIDSYCLNNLSMAHSSETQRYTEFCNNVFKEHPKAIILTSLRTRLEVLYTPADACLKTLLERQNTYRLSKKFTSVSPESIYQYEVFTLY